ncbi:Ig-like domain-containing protein [Flavobacterium lacus]|uniref:Putative repeat protein (TIGR03806 family) n=1 Tax=Flavobacterium lacus TaxID=1353778 RepID=A0A328WPU5_9FLAO|nr:hypothetical protein [Flavobacterium lacus]RAR47136.1 putative repeat protein (TIGR03806 family) [Flavobacterium lacus]
MKKYYTFLPFAFSFVLLSYFVVSCSDDDKYTPVDDLPIATNDVLTYTAGMPVDINVLENDTTGDEVDPATVSLVDGVDTDSNGTLDRKEVFGEGVWSVNSEGVVNFSPVLTFLGNPTIVSYTVMDFQGNSSNAATIALTVVSGVVVDLSQVPYAKLSDYNFFVGLMKDQNPTLGVLPYEPASSLFTDYALKKRFVWMPEGTLATYNGDGNVLELPTGAVIIKNFYYNNVQPSNTTRIIESRLMIRKTTGWIFAEYVWNAEQTEAFLSMNGSNTSVTWLDENNIQRSTNYRIPSEGECFVCHKSNEVAIPIGIKPQNINVPYNYVTGSQNQLAKWIQMGYLENTIPSNILTTVNYKDETQSLDLRARSYVDINCAHCHQSNSHCDYRPMRFAFSESADLVNMGVCVDTQDMAGFPSALGRIVTPGNINRSMLHHRVGSTDTAVMMPLVGRTLVHEEGLQLIEAWINSLDPCE